MPVETNPAGWTDVTPAADTRIAYCDATAGNDGSALFYDYDDAAIGADPYNPVGPINAYQTIAAAKGQPRNGMADWVLFKKGEEWKEGISFFNNSGRSGQEPILFGAYGTGARPLMMPGDGLTGIRTNSGFSNVFVIGVKVYGAVSDPTHQDYIPDSKVEAYQFLSQAGQGNPQYLNLLVEDCVYDFCGVSIQDKTGQPILALNYRRSQFLNNYAKSGNHEQGLYVSGSDDLLMEECLFDHNGWYGDRDTGGGTPNGDATIFNHNIYIDNENNTGNVVLKGCILANASSHGIQARTGGVIEDNLFVRNPINILVGGGDTPEADQPDGVDGVVRRNAIIEANDITIPDRRGFGIDMENIRSISVTNNVIAHDINATGINVRAYSITGSATLPSRGISIIANTVYDHRRGAIWINAASVLYVTIDAEEDNEYWDAASLSWPVTGTNRNAESVEFVDPTRDVAAYSASIGGAGTVEDFLLEARKQSRDNWRPEYMGINASAWIRAGYIDSGPVPPKTPSNLTVTVA